MFLHELMGEESYRRYLSSTKDRNVDEVRELIRNAYIGSYERNGFGLYLVELESSGEALGICGLVKRDTLKDVDLGYGFLNRHWSKGYALEAARRVVEHAREDLGLERLVAATNPENKASKKLLEKLGMRHEGSVEVVPGMPADDLYGMAL